MKTMSLNERLSHHCNKAIERGDGPIAGIPAEIEILRADRSEYNERNGKNMAGCIAKAGSVIAYFPTQSALRSAPLYASAFDLLEILKSAVARIEIANEEGDRILSAWLPDARAAISKAEGLK